MESNQTSNEPTEAQAQSNQTSTKPNASQSQSTPAPAPETHKSSKAPWTVAAVTSVLAIAGIAFGIYGFIDSNSKSAEIANLKSKINLLQNETGADSIENNNETGANADTEAETDNNTNGNNEVYAPSHNGKSNPIITKTTDDGEYNIMHTISKKFGFYDYEKGKDYELSIEIKEGAISSCGLLSGDSLVHSCEIKGLNGKVYKISTLSRGHTGNPPIAFIMENGTVQTINPDDAISSTSLNAEEMKTDKFITDIIDGIDERWCAKDNTGCAGGAITYSIVYSDGTYYIPNE